MPLSVCAHFVCVCVSSVCVCFVFVCVSVDILLWLSLGLMTRQVGLSQAGESTRISSGAAEEHRCTFPLFTTLKKCQRGHLEMYIKTSKWANSRANEKKIWLSLLMFYHQFQIQTMVSSYGWILIERCRCGAGGWTAMGSLVPDKTSDNKEEGKRQRRRRWQTTKEIPKTDQKWHLNKSCEHKNKLASLKLR